MLTTVKIKFFFLLFLLLSSTVHAQIEDFNKFWQPIGPYSMPDNALSISATGIGPVEFIRVHPTEKGQLLAGSLNGGLFHSDNGGEFWNIAGSDSWDYSACAWADFHPVNHNIWFACSNESGDNGGPGKIGEKGGVMRTMNGGIDWELVGDYRNFAGSQYVKLFGTRFHPKDPNLILVLTSVGLFYTESSLSDNVQWLRVPNVNGWVYDVDFIDGNMYITNFDKDKWELLKFNQDDFQRHQKIAGIQTENKGLQYLTIEPSGKDLLVLKVFSNDKDEVWKYHPNKNTQELLLDKQQITFGFGRTFAVNPHNVEEFYLGYNTRLRKWNAPYNGTSPIGGDYHVDIEFIAFDPFDSLKVYMATHGGVYISEDGAQNWEFKSENFGNAEVMGLAVSPSDPNQIVIGTYHDGSMLRADFDKNGNYFWRTVNGGDGLIPLIDPNHNGVVYTSNQYNGGGLYYSDDTIKTNSINLHNQHSLKSAGWEMAATLNGALSKVVYFNFVEKSGANKNNIDICRLVKNKTDENFAIISDFNASHKLSTYKVYGLFTSKHHPNTLLAYVLDYTKDENGKAITVHRLYRNDFINSNPLTVMKSWVELQIPKKSWIADVEIDGNSSNIIYISYTRGGDVVNTYDNAEMVYAVKYKDLNSYSAKRKIDISRNVPSETSGRYNLEYTSSFGGGLFIATKSGVYFGSNKVLKGRKSWLKIGNGLPHCKIYGLDFNEESKVLTVGLFGRGVWQYNLLN